MKQLINTQQIVAIYNNTEARQLQDIKVINSLKVKRNKMSKSNKNYAQLCETIAMLEQSYKAQYAA